MAGFGMGYVPLDNMYALLSLLVTLRKTSLPTVCLYPTQPWSCMQQILLLLRASLEELIHVCHCDTCWDVRPFMPPI